MSQEIVDAVRSLAREKGISEDKLVRALEDALLSAYKKQPGAARYARGHLDRELGEYRVEELLLPEDLEDQLLDEAEELASGELAGRRSFTGELLGATDDAVTVAADTGVVSIPYADITRSNLVGD